MYRFKDELYDKLCDRDNNECQWCGIKIPKRQGQFAHRIGQGKLNRKIYGDDIIDHPVNKKLVCDLNCNKKVDITNNPLEVREVLKEIIYYELENKGV